MINIKYGGSISDNLFYITVCDGESTVFRAALDLDKCLDDRWFTKKNTDPDYIAPILMDLMGNRLSVVFFSMHMKQELAHLKAEIIRRTRNHKHKWARLIGITE